MTKREYIAVGEHYWERRESEKEAIAAMRKRLRGGGMTPPKYQLSIYDVPAGATIDGMGHLQWQRDADLPPELLYVVEITKANGATKVVDVAVRKRSDQQ